jgi:hypothetical protein
MRNLAFTMAFGDERYMRMARALERSISQYSPNTEFKIFAKNDFTPYSEGLPKRRKLYPKDFKYPKIEVMTKLSDPDTRYMFIDADAFVFGDLSPYFEQIKPNELTVEYVYNGKNGWAGVPNLQFSTRCKEAGLNGVEPYSLNSGFMMWQGKMPCFSTALELIKNVTINDSKGQKGDEYYYCAAIQLSKTIINPLDYEKVHLGKFWNGKIKMKGDRLVCSAYPKNDRIIQHYGNHNYDNPHVKRLLRKFGVCGYDVKGWIRYKNLELRSLVKSSLGLVRMRPPQ